VTRAASTTVTVVIAARDAEATIGAALRSALAEPLVVQCVVVDDASTDATGSTAASIARADPRVQVVRRQARGGPSVARNDGLARAVGARVCFLDADDALVATGLAALSKALSSAPLAVAALGRFRAVDDAGLDVDVGSWAAGQLLGVVRREGRLIESPNGLTPEALVTRLVSPPPGAWLVDASTARAVGGFDPRGRRSEDLELLVRPSAAGALVPVERDVLSYRRHDRQHSAAAARR
jgi:glycosyltransferase involved in cell wall biosynthesis